jgi:hypothetical protein
MRDEKTNLNFWYPALSQVVKTPKTIIIESECETLHLCDGVKPDGIEHLYSQIKEAAEQVGFPAFIRTGMTSGKHYGYCFLDTPEQIPQRVYQLTEWSAMADISGLPLGTWAIRERLNLEASFSAFHGLPVNRERRYFIENGEVICHHPYWPEHAIRDATIENWQELLAKLNYESEEEIKLLTDLSKQVSLALPGAWSLDWAITKDGEWYAIDMAEARISYHWPECPASAQSHTTANEQQAQ